MKHITKESYNRIYFISYGATPDDTTESVATLFVASTINLSHTSFMFNCSGSKIYDPEVRDEGSGQPGFGNRASRNHNTVYHVGLEPTHTQAKRKVLSLHLTSVSLLVWQYIVCRNGDTQLFSRN